MSKTKSYFDKIKNSGISDLREYFINNPSAFTYCVRSSRPFDINKAALELYEASSKKEYTKKLQNGIEIDPNFHSALEYFTNLGNGKTIIDYDQFVRSLKGTLRISMFRLDSTRKSKNIINRV
jgi:hypothetical protein